MSIYIFSCWFYGNEIIHEAKSSIIFYSLTHRNLIFKFLSKNMNIEAAYMMTAYIFSMIAISVHFNSVFTSRGPSGGAGVSHRCLATFSRRFHTKWPTRAPTANLHFKNIVLHSKIINNFFYSSHQ